MIRSTSSEDTFELAWFKSSYSDSSNPNDCVEVALAEAAVHVRDSKTPHGPRLGLSPTAWASFLAYTSER